jgi:hypothetical protein
MEGVQKRSGLGDGKGKVDGYGGGDRWRAKRSDWTVRLARQEVGSWSIE